MKKILLILMITLCLYAFFACLFFSKVNAATVNAASASQAHVEAAIATAVDGDSVIVPAGSATWTSRIDVSEELTIIGAGMGRCDSLNIDTADSTVITGYLFDFANGTDNWRVSGLKLDANGVDASQLDAGQA